MIRLPGTTLDPPYNVRAHLCMRVVQLNWLTSGDTRFQGTLPSERNTFN